MKLPNKLEGRQLFLIIIDSYAKRFASLNRKYNYIISKHNEFENKKASKERKAKKAIERYSSKIEPEEPEEQQQEKQQKEEQKSDNANEDMMDIDKPNQDEVSEKQETPSPLDMFNIDSHSPIAAIPVSNNTDVLKRCKIFI